MCDFVEIHGNIFLVYPKVYFTAIRKKRFPAGKTKQYGSFTYMSLILLNWIKLFINLGDINRYLLLFVFIW